MDSDIWPRVRRMITLVAPVCNSHRWSSQGCAQMVEGAVKRRLRRLLSCASSVVAAVVRLFWLEAAGWSADRLRMAAALLQFRPAWRYAVRRDLRLLANLEEILEASSLVISWSRPKQKVQLLERAAMYPCGLMLQHD